MKSTYLKVVTLSLGIFPLANGLANAARRVETQSSHNNVLLIICDDLRPELNCFDRGKGKVFSPNIDALSKRGVKFSRAYCNIPVSGASRASFLTGTRPTKTKFWNWNCRVDVDQPNVVTIQEHLKNNGYTTVSNGKVYHHDNDYSCKYWDRHLPMLPTSKYVEEKNLVLQRDYLDKKTNKRGYYYDNSYAPDSIYSESILTDKSINDLKSLAQGDKQFFMAVGYVRPHLPFIAPRKYWDLYPSDQIKLPDNYVLKPNNNIPQRAITTWGELRSYSGVPSIGPINPEDALRMIHGYRACVSFVDAQIGRLLTALRELGLDHNTTIILIGDNGWSLGENSMWCKHTTFNTSLNVPLIIASPNGISNHRSDQIVEYVDLYPTICDIAGLSKPSHLEGESIESLLYDRRAHSKGYCVARHQDDFVIVKGDYFYTERWDKDCKTIWRMLFDHKTDPQENYNLAERTEYSKIVENLSCELRNKRGSNFEK